MTTTDSNAMATLVAAVNGLLDEEMSEERREALLAQTRSLSSEQIASAIIEQVQEMIHLRNENATLDRSMEEWQRRALAAEAKLAQLIPANEEWFELRVYWATGEYAGGYGAASKFYTLKEAKIGIERSFHLGYGTPDTPLHLVQIRKQILIKEGQGNA